MSPKQSRSRYLYAALVFIVAAALIAFALSGTVTEKDVVGSFQAMLGTFLGALFAFRLNENKEQRKIEKEQKAALNRALFVLARQHNAIKSIAKHINPYTSEFERAFNLAANKPPSYSDLTHNFEELEFLLETVHLNVLMKLTVEQERFRQALEALRMRNNFYVDEVQPELARLSLNGQMVSVDQMKISLGERIFGTAINGANDLYAHIQDSSKSIPAMHAELFNVAKEIFPSERFIKFEPEQA